MNRIVKIYCLTAIQYEFKAAAYPAAYCHWNPFGKEIPLFLLLRIQLPFLCKTGMQVWLLLFLSPLPPGCFCVYSYEQQHCTMKEISLAARHFIKLVKEGK